MKGTARPVKKTPAQRDKVDERLERIRETIWPSDPYLMDLVAPSSYHLPPYLANNWRRSCPFDKDEEQLQYMTFLPHTGRGDTMLRTIGDWDDGNGSLKIDSTKRTSGSTSSGAISPLPGQAPRKKISLLDYNRKKAGQTGGKTSPKALNGGNSLTTVQPLQVAEVIAKPTVQVSELVKDTSPQTSEQQSRIESLSRRKRSAEEMTNGQGRKMIDPPQASTAPKEVQTESRSPAAAATIATPAKGGSIRGLPRMLSPTLPACIEERLAKLQEDVVKAELHPAQPLGSNRLAFDTNKAAATTYTPLDTSKGQTDAKESGAKESVAKESDAKESAVISKVPARDPNTKSIPKANPAAVREATRRNPTDELEDLGVRGIERRLVVILRIPKSLRKNCQRILQLQPRPKKSVSLASSLALQDSPQNRNHDQTTATSQGNQKQKASENIAKANVVTNGPPRLANPDKEPPSKRQRITDIDLSRPQTPGGSAVRSPGLPQHSSGSKSQLATPQADRKSIAMERIKSFDGDVKTPMGSMRSSTPVVSGSTGTDTANNNREGRSSSNVSATSAAAAPKKDEEASVYRAEFNKYADMAKSLKREADKLAKVPGGHFNPEPKVRRQGLAKGIETAICYMLAFTIKDEPSRTKKVPCDRAPWISLLPYFNFLKNLSRDTESLHLQGLIRQLEAVCWDTIHQYDLDRLERETGADEVSIRNVAESRRQVRQAWIDGTNWLTFDDLRRCFPETWAQRSRSRGDKLGRILPQHYQGGYYLPLSNISTNIEGIRVGWCSLKEWCKKEDVIWTGSIGL
ncbi:MAG: hypothetical protein Q9169_005213 [Polycauliona sp. 2 TL-2023]